MLAPFGIRPKGTLLARMLPLARVLARRGHAVSIVAPPVHNPEDAGTRVVYNGVPIIHTAPLRPGPAGALHQSGAMLRQALAERPDLLHLFKPRGFGGLAALFARALRPALPLVVDADDWEGRGGWNDLLPYPGYAKRLFAWQERDLPRRAAAVTVASRTLESLVWAMGVAPERVFYLPNGLAAAPTLLAGRANDAAAPALALYTRFWELDVAELAATLAAIHLRRPDARLIVIGRGERGEERELRARAERAGFLPMLDERGWLEPAQIPAALAEAEIALAPARDTLINRARCSAKLLELLGAGLAVVASDVGETRSFIEHERSGLLVPPGNPGAFAAAALRLLDDPALRARLAAGARQAAARYAWENLATIAERAYTFAVRRKQMIP
ncbi:MAG: glycosyltransferase [Oscillochloridaceae bacterium]|nr:glycosyltransferase [Chloroflexaceae bacterium]MDW8389414.1 glycosyltransferase [Oscillochloridaceae bacterium]